MSDFPRQVVEGRTARPRVGLVLGPQEGPGSLPLFNLNKCTQKKKIQWWPSPKARVVRRRNGLLLAMG